MPAKAQFPTAPPAVSEKAAAEKTEMEIRMRIIGGAIILVIAVWLYVVSTRMVNKDKKENHTGCDGNCAGCMSGCMTHTDNDKSH